MIRLNKAGTTEGFSRFSTLRIKLLIYFLLYMERLREADKNVAYNTSLKCRNQGRNVPNQGIQWYSDTVAVIK